MKLDISMYLSLLKLTNKCNLLGDAMLCGIFANHKL